MSTSSESQKRRRAASYRKGFADGVTAARIVKPLEWVRPEGIHHTVTFLRAECSFGFYEAWGGGAWNINGGPNVTGGPRGIEASTAAAQADYESRVLGALQVIAEGAE